MKARAPLLALILFALVGARPPVRYQPNPSAVIAAEMAASRLAQEKGQWTALRETAAKDAVLFVPQKVTAPPWLKARANPSRPAAWSPSVVYASCDGRLAASTGNWTRPDGAAGYFTTIWRRDDKGAWKWVMRHGDALAVPRDAPDHLTGKVATCKRRADAEGAAEPASGAKGVGKKRGRAPAPADDSLLWSADVMPDGSRRITVRMWTGAAYDVVIDDRVAAPAS
ncbi:MAG: hypothetical protein AB7E60_01650 [Sphingobium sp.]